MTKKDLTSAVQGIVQTNISPVQKLFNASNITEEVAEKKEQKTDKQAKETKTIKQSGRPLGTTKPPTELRKNPIVHYFSDNELKNIENAGITQGELSAILRLRLKEMGVGISIK